MNAIKRVMTGLLLGAVLAPAAPALAQPTPWNRKVEGFSVMPDPDRPTRVEIRPYYSIAADAPTIIDLGTTLEVLVNGTVVSSQLLPVVAGPSEAMGCTLHCPMGSTCLCCEVGEELVCICDFWLAPAIPVETTLRPHDEIMVLLRPAPGAVPEDDTSDDLHVMNYQGTPIFWNRKITSVEVTPGTGDTVDVAIEGVLEAGYDGRPNVETEVELFVDGVSHGRFPTGPGDFEWSQCTGTGCSGPCAWAPDGSVGGECVELIDFCACAIVDPPFEMSITDVRAPSGSTVKVKLVPVPGALPELPGFEEDDEEESEVPGGCADLDGDGLVGVTDLLLILAAWGPCAGCPEDLDGDDVVGAGDLVMLLAAWGPCPV
jgi:hypothetical protein